MSNYWVGEQTTCDKAVLVYDPTVQISEEYVYLFNSHIGCIEQLDRVNARATVRTAVNPLEQESAIKAYLEWLTADAGRQFTNLIRQYQKGPEIPNYLHKLYGSGYRDGYAGYNERVFDARMPEICRREYNRGYIDGANDFAVEESLTVPDEADDEDESYYYESYPDLEAIEEHQQQLRNEERVYQNRLRYDQAKWPRDEYEQYLKSDHWLLTKITALVRAKFQCQLCGGQKYRLSSD